MTSIFMQILPKKKKEEANCCCFDHQHGLLVMCLQTKNKAKLKK